MLFIPFRSLLSDDCDFVRTLKCEPFIPPLLSNVVYI